MRVIDRNWTRLEACPLWPAERPPVHGALGEPEGLEPTAFKLWMGEHEGSAGFDAAVAACEPERPAKVSGPAPEELVACLRNRGLTPPATIDQLKPWMAQQDGTAAGRAVLTACGVDSRPTEKARGDGSCGGDKPTVVEKAKAAARPRASSAKTAPGL
jgi:hypothetical protein